MVWYNFSDLFWYIIQLWNEGKKFNIYFKKEKKEKHSIRIHWDTNLDQQIQSPMC